TVTASDIHGNTSVKTSTVIFQPPAPNQPRLLVISGDVQIDRILRPLSEPIVVRALQPDGTPFVNKAINLQVTRSDGRLLPVDETYVVGDITTHADYSANGTMFLQIVTDANGEASAFWTLGTEAGCGNNRVCVSSAGIPENAYFCASATPAPP